MIIEKCKTEQEINMQMNKIIEMIKEPKDKGILSEIVTNIITPLVGKEKANEMLEKINEKEGIGMSPFTKMMFDFQREKEKAIAEGRAEGRAKGIKEGEAKGIVQAMIETAKKMLQKDMKMQDIQDITGLSKKELKEIKENLAKA